jgi:hypothetical protein
MKQQSNFDIDQRRQQRELDPSRAGPYDSLALQLVETSRRRVRSPAALRTSLSRA